jgi:hypothetical protein
MRSNAIGQVGEERVSDARETRELRAFRAG